MTKEEKELLMKDLSSRLRYGVKVAAVVSNGESNTIGGYCDVLEDFYISEVDGWFNVSMIKPYLRPMSSMTMKERYEYDKFVSSNSVFGYQNAANWVHWLDEHYFDYNGLIEKGLALEAPEGMY